MNFKKLAVACLLSFTLLNSQPSHSFVAIAAWNPILMGAGLAATMVGGIIAGGSVSAINNYKMPKWLEYISIGFAGLGAAIGLPGTIILDGAHGQKVQLVTISENDALKLNISEDERLIFNQEIDQANIIIDEINESLSQKTQPNIEDSIKLWNELGGSLNPLTLSAMNKILNH